MLFVDSSDLKAIARVQLWGVCNGVTTNPLILQKELAPGESVQTRIRDVLAAHTGEVSVQLVEEGVDDMVREARAWFRESTRLVSKVPFSENGLRAIAILRASDNQRVPTNATAIMTFSQAYLAARAGARYVSIFWNRIRDIEGDPHFVVRRTREIFDRERLGTQIIAGSIRSPWDVSEALKAGAHVVTVPPAVLEKMLAHPQTTAVRDQFLAASADIELREAASKSA